MTTVLTVNAGPIRGRGEGPAQQEYDLEYEVKMSDGYGTPEQAAAATGVTIGTALAWNANAFAYDAEAVQRSDVCFWDVKIKVKTFFTSQYEKEKWSVSNPTARSTRISGAWQAERVPVPYDRDGNLICNSAGQVPDPRFEADQFFDAYHFVTNVSLLPDWYFTYRRARFGTTNSSDFKFTLQNGQDVLVKKGCGRLQQPRFSDLKSENGVDFYELSFDLLVREAPISDDTQEGWVFDMLDQGKMERIPSATAYADNAAALRAISGQDGQQVSDPWLLNGDGGAVGKSLGAWDSGTAYLAADPGAEPATWGDIVTRNDVDYYCIQNSTGDDPETATAYWRKLPHVIYWDWLKAVDYRILPGCSVP